MVCCIHFKKKLKGVFHLAFEATSQSLCYIVENSQLTLFLRDQALNDVTTHGNRLLG